MLLLLLFTWDFQAVFNQYHSIIQYSVKLLTNHFRVLGLRILWVAARKWFFICLHVRRFINCFFHFRIFWFILLICLSVWLGHGLVAGLNKYLGYPVSTVVTVSYVESLHFPAVTFCNYNLFKNSKVHPNPNIRTVSKTLLNCLIAFAFNFYLFQLTYQRWFCATRVFNMYAWDGISVGRSGCPSLSLGPFFFRSLHETPPPLPIPRPPFSPCGICSILHSISISGKCKSRTSIYTPRIPGWIV